LEAFLFFKKIILNSLNLSTSKVALEISSNASNKL
jgi:hypothetical protein